MADDGRTTLGKLTRGAVFRTADGLLWRRTGIYPSAGPELVYCERVGANANSSQLRADLEVEPLDLPALLKELAELRTLAHDLLIDRDAAYGREVGRGEALAAAEKWWEDVQDVDREVGLLFDAIRGPTPVRPLPPPERLAARCRALEDALRAVVSAWDDSAWNDPGATLSPQGPIDAARKLLEEISADE
jgi:hypothetical protein